MRFTLSLPRDRDGWYPDEAACADNVRVPADIRRKAFASVLRSTAARGPGRGSDGLPDLLEIARMPKDQQEAMRQILERVSAVFGPGASSRPAA